MTDDKRILRAKEIGEKIKKLQNERFHVKKYYALRAEVDFHFPWVLVLIGIIAIFIPILAPFAIFYNLGVIYYIVKQLRDITPKRKELKKHKKELDPSRTTYVIDSEIEKLTEEAKGLFGYTGRDDESDYYAIMKYIVYTGLSEEEIFDCWPFDKFKSFYSTYSSAYSYVKYSVTSSNKNLNGTVDRIVGDIRALNTLLPSPDSSDSWYITLFNTMGTLICHEYQKKYYKLVAETYPEEKMKVENPEVINEFKNVLTLLFSQADTPEKQEYAGLLCIIAERLGITYSLTNS